MNVIFWAAIVLGVLGIARLVWAAAAESWRAAGARIDADVAFLRAIPADMEWPTDIDPEWVEK